MLGKMAANWAECGRSRFDAHSIVNRRPDPLSRRPFRRFTSPQYRRGYRRILPALIAYLRTALKNQCQLCSKNREDGAPRDDWWRRHRHRYRQAFSNAVLTKPAGAKTTTRETDPGGITLAPLGPVIFASPDVAVSGYPQIYRQNSGTA